MYSCVLCSIIMNFGFRPRAFLTDYFRIFFTHLLAFFLLTTRIKALTFNQKYGVKSISFQGWVSCRFVICTFGSHSVTSVFNAPRSHFCFVSVFLFPLFVSAGDEPPFEIVLLQRRRLAAGLLRTALYRPEEAERRLQVSNREPHGQSCRRQHSPPPANTKCQAPQATYCPGTVSLINTVY